MSKAFSVNNRQNKTSSLIQIASKTTQYDTGTHVNIYVTANTAFAFPVPLPLNNENDNLIFEDFLFFPFSRAVL